MRYPVFEDLAPAECSIVAVMQKGSAMRPKVMEIWRSRVAVIIEGRHERRSLPTAKRRDGEGGSRRSGERAAGCDPLAPLPNLPLLLLNEAKFTGTRIHYTFGGTSGG
jgi:hypothetical protein